MRPLIIAGITLSTIACGMGSKPPAPDLPPWRMVKDANGVEMRLVEKAPYSYLYSVDGVLRQLKYDSNNDQKPDVFAYFSGRSTPDRLELDESRDGKIDRWEEYNEAGILVRYATSAKGGKAERFVEIDPATKVALRVEIDADHDGRKERRETFSGGQMVRSEIDTNGDGKLDRVQNWNKGLLQSEEIDRDGDGQPDVRITHAKGGAVAKVERLTK